MSFGIQIIGLDAIGRLKSRLLAIHNMADNLGPLMENWERLIEVGNRKGVLAGTDKDGNPAPTLSYRPFIRLGRKLTVAQRLGQHPNKRRGEYFGRGPAASGWNNNLSSSEYRKLDGPRLAPRKQFSRVITNFMTGHYRDPSTPSKWVATGAWVDVVNVKGDKFLHYHFDGDGQLPYDLRGVRPDDVEQCKQALREWAKLQIRESYKATAAES